MYQSTDHLVSTEQGGARPGYQAIEGRSENATADNNVPPPETPQTFLSQVKKAREDNTNVCSFCLAFFGLLIGSIVWTVILIVIVTVPIVMIVIGSEYLHNCPAEYMIPICLIVGGCVSLLGNVLNFAARFRRMSDSSMPKRHTVIGWVNLVFNLFLAGWFIASCYFVYSTRPTFKDSANPNYCQPELYGFIYWLLNFCFIFLAATIFISGCIGFCAIICW